MGQDRMVFKEIETEENTKYSEIKFSHIVTFWGIKCLWSDESNKLLPVGPIRKIIVPFFVKIHLFLSDITCAFMPGFEPAIPLKVIGIITQQTVTREDE